MLSDCLLCRKEKIMLLSLLSNFSSNPRIAIVSMLLLIPTLLISLTVHEYAHGRVALAIGDKTALMAGRLSLNPLHHLDPVGSLMLLLFGFGYARPVPINPRNFDRVSYKTGIMLVSLAGPVSNFILALLGILGLHVLDTVAFYISINEITYLVTGYFFLYFALMNIGLGVFNLIPLPPLDGSRILTIFLPAKAQMWFYRYERYIQLAIFALIFLGYLDTPLLFLREQIFNGMNKLISLIPFLM